MKNTLFFVLSLVASVATVQQADAALIVSVVPSAPTYNVGQIGYVDVFVQSNASDAVDSYLVGLNITGGGVDFSSQSESFLTFANDVFYNNSLDVDSALQATLVDSSGDPIEISVGDVSLDGVTPPAWDPETPRLLARLDFVATSISDPITVELDSSSSFADNTFNLIALSATSGSFAVVPEPASLGMVAMAGMGLLRRKRRA